MNHWDICMVLILLTVQMEYSKGNDRAISLDCSIPTKKNKLTIILLKENEECPPPMKISCKIMPSRRLTSIHMRKIEDNRREDRFPTEAIFPVNTWKERELELIIDNSMVTIVPNISAYRYQLPRAFETVSGSGTVDIECKVLMEGGPSSPSVDQETTSASASLSGLHIALIVLALLVFLAFAVALIIFLIRRRRVKQQTEHKREIKQQVSLEYKNSLLENEYSSKKSMGAAVYIDPAAPSDYDNKNRAGVSAEKPTSGEYSYPYMDMTSVAKNQDTSNRKKPGIKSQVSEIPYEDVEGTNDIYSVAS